MFKVVFCGDAAVGKSSLIMRLYKDQFHPNITTTLGVDFQNKQIEVDSKRIALQLWDTAGQERFRSVAKSYFRRCDGVILVYDATYERSFLNVREWINTITDSTPKKVSVMIVANKIDLRDQMRAEGKRVIEHAEGVRLAKVCYSR
jgi:Ras and EF-hand domain-containing protein